MTSYVHFTTAPVIEKVLCVFLALSIAIYPIQVKSATQALEERDLVIDTIKTIKKHGLPSEIELQDEFNEYRFMDDLYDHLMRPENMKIIETLKILPIGNTKIILAHGTEKVLIDKINFDKLSLNINGKNIALAEIKSFEDLKTKITPQVGFNFFIPKAHAFFAMLAMGLLAVFALPKIMSKLGACKGSSKGIFAANCGGSKKKKKKNCSDLKMLDNFVEACLDDGLKSSRDQRYYARKKRPETIERFVLRGKVNKCEGRSSMRKTLKKQRKKKKSKLKRCLKRIPSSSNGKGAEDGRR